MDDQMKQTFDPKRDGASEILAVKGDGKSIP